MKHPLKRLVDPKLNTHVENEMASLQTHFRERTSTASSKLAFSMSALTKRVILLPPSC